MKMMTKNTNLRSKPEVTQATSGEVVSPGASMPVLKLDIVPKKPNTTVNWNLVSVAGILTLEKAQEMGKIKILKKTNDAIYIQLLNKPTFYKLRRIEWVEGQGPVDLQKYDNVEILIVKQIEP